MLYWLRNEHDTFSSYLHNNPSAHSIVVSTFQGIVDSIPPVPIEATQHNQRALSSGPERRTSTCSDELRDGSRENSFSLVDESLNGVEADAGSACNLPKPNTA